MKLLAISLCALAATLLPRAEGFHRVQIPSAIIDRDYALSGARLWLNGRAMESSFVMAGDVEGSHRADLLEMAPLTGDINIAHTSAVGKPEADAVALAGFAPGAIAAACAAFGDARPEGGAADAVVAVCASGDIRVASEARRDDLGYVHFQKNRRAASLSSSQMPQAPLEAIVGDFDGDGHADLLLVGHDDRALFLRASRDAAGAVRLTPIPVTTPFPLHRQVGAGLVADTPLADRRSRLFFLDDKGSLFRSALQVAPDQKTAKVAPPVHLIDGIAPESRLAVGHFRGAPACDLIVGDQMLPGANPENRYKLAALSSIVADGGDRMWLVADFDGNGKEDLARIRKAEIKLGGDAAYIHFSYDPNREQVAGYYASSNDGLPDAWKLGLIHPGGLNLKALGCQVRHYDLIAEVIPISDVPSANLRSAMEEVTRQYAALPIRDLDNTTGIYFHYILRNPIPASEVVRGTGVDKSKGYGKFWASAIIPGHVGVVHYFILHNTGINGGGATGTFMSYCNTDWRGIMHEMGHQLGLSHGGGEHFQEMSVTYPSLMNYAYGRSIDGSQQVSYSDGRLAALGTLNEEHLDETLPLPYDAVKFMAGKPYHFHMKPGRDPNTTLIDWNWDGVLGEKDVRADLSYSDGIETAPRFNVARSYSAPVTVAQTDSAGKTHLILITGMPPAERETGDTGGEDLAPQTPGRLWVRVWTGENRDTDGMRWSLPVAIAPSGVTGDATAVSVGGATYVAYPTTGGVAINRLTVGADGKLTVSPAAIVPSSANTLPSLAACSDGYLALTLWSGPTVPVTLSLLPVAPTDTAPNVTTIGRPKSLGILSAAPIASVAGAASTETDVLWIARDTGVKANNFEVCRFDVSRPGSDPAVRLAARRRVHGNFAPRRPALLWEPEPGLGPQGRLYVLACGREKRNADEGGSPQFCAMQTGYPNETEGWQLRRFDKVHTLSRSAPAACWFEGNMVYAMRATIGKKPSRDDMVALSFYGTGASPQPIGYSNDLDWITRYGLSQKIETVRVP